MKPVINLALLAGFCGALLAFANWQTRPIIEQSQASYELEQLLAIVGDQYELEAVNKQRYVLTKDNQPAGQLFQIVASNGYNGDIRLWLGVSNAGKVLGARVIEHQETPGLGDRFEPTVSDWIFSLEGKSLSDSRWDVKKYGGDFDGFTGATITPRAIVSRIGQALADSAAQSQDTYDE